MIETWNLTKSFGPRTALAGIDLLIREGEFVTLVGPNGAGKTTLLRVLATIARPSSGSVRIGGVDPGRRGERVRGQIGFLSHRTLLYDDLTAEQNLRFYARMYAVAEASVRIGDLLEQLGLGARRRDRVRTFSGGMKQRLAIARAVLHGPQVLLLDEPYAGLDPVAVETLTDMLVNLTGEGRTMLLATHRMSRGLAVGERVLVLHRGRLIYDQPREAISAQTFADTYRAMTT